MSSPRKPYTVAMMLVCVLAASCSPPERGKPKIQVPEGGLLLRGAGATFPAPLYERWFAEYQRLHPKVLVVYDRVGSGQGVKRLIGKSPELTADDAVDFAGSDAAMTDAEMAEVEGGVQLLPVTAGTLVLAYNLPGFTIDLRLSRATYTGIFLGQITEWNDPRIATDNPGSKFPPWSIVLVTRQDSSGTTFALTNHLSAISTEWRDRFGAATLVNWPGNAMRADGNAGTAGRIKGSLGSIGYVPYGFAKQLGLKMASLENKTGRFVTPSAQSGVATLAAASLPENLRLFFADPEGEESYPLVTFTWILVRRKQSDSQKAVALQDLCRWCLTEGQHLSEELGYVPLPSNVVTAATAAVEAIGCP